MLVVLVMRGGRVGGGVSVGVECQDDNCVIAVSELISRGMGAWGEPLKHIVIVYRLKKNTTR